MINIGIIGKPHGLKGEVNVELFYSYSLEILNNSMQAVINNQLYFVENIFGVVNNKIKLKLKEINSVEEAKKLVNLNLFSIVIGDKFYPASIIGKQIKKNNKIIGKIIDVHNFNAGDIFELDNNLMFSFDEITKIEEFIHIK